MAGSGEKPSSTHSSQSLSKKSRYFKPKVANPDKPSKSSKAKSSGKTSATPTVSSKEASKSQQSPKPSEASSPTTRMKTGSLPSGKRSRSPSPPHSKAGTRKSFDEASSKLKEDQPKPLKPSLSQKSQGSGSSKKLKVSFSLQSEASESKSEQSPTSRPPDGELPEPSPNMNVGNIGLDDYTLFKRYYETRKFCPIVWVDLEHFKKKFKFDMTVWLEQFMPLLSIKLPYSPEVVRIFYHNMIVQQKENASDDDVLVTKVRDQEIKLSAHDINVLLGIVDVPEDPPKLSPIECYHILFPDGPPPPEGSKLNVTPPMMKDEYRVL